jgi:hypothetical protein
VALDPITSTLPLLISASVGLVAFDGQTMRRRDIFQNFISLISDIHDMNILCGTT